MNITNWKFNHETKSVELTLETGVVISVPEDIFVNVIKTLPEFDDEYQVRELLKKLWEIRERRLLTYDAISKEVQGLREQHKKIREKLDTTVDKARIFALSAQTKDLGAEKVVLAELRMQIKLLGLEEANLKGQLAKILVGKGNQ